MKIVIDNLAKDGYNKDLITIVIIKNIIIYWDWVSLHKL